MSNWLIFARIVDYISLIVVTLFGIYCMFNGRYIEALMCGIYSELNYIHGTIRKE